MVLIALGIGGIKSTITPFIGLLPNLQLQGTNLINLTRGPIQTWKTSAYPAKERGVGGG
jgi:hypothetical protein